MRVARLLKGITNGINSLSLQQKLIALYIVIIIIPIIIFTSIYSNDVYDRAINEIRIKNENALEIEQIHIKNNIETMRRTAQMVVSDVEFIDFVRSRNEANINELIDFKMNELSNVTRLQHNNPAIENIRLYTTNPHITEMWPILFKEERVLNKPWREDVIQRNGMELWWFDQQTEDVLDRLPSQNTSKISLLRELDYPKDEHLGIIEINMFLKNFFPKMFGTVNDSGSVYVVLDKDMNMIRNYHHTFFEDEGINTEKLKREFQQFKHTGTGSFEYKDNNTPYLVITAYLDDLDAYMLNVISLESLYAETAKTRNVFLSGIIFLVIVLSLFTYVLISLLLKKMYQLKASMKRVEKGDFNFDLEISGNDEIAELGYHFKSMVGKINGLIVEAVNKQAAAKETELKALKTQIDSHFLYNTLENIKMMAEIEGKFEISDAVTSLGEMMRYNLKWKNDFVLLEEELNYIKNYVEIMNLRLDGLITLNIEIPQDLIEQEVLKMSLQPIIENAIKHGIIPKNEPGVLDVTARQSEGTVFIAIKDNGIGMSPSQCELLNEAIQTKQDPDGKSSSNGGNGIGIRNVNERIKLYYGNKYGVKVTSVEGEYTMVTVSVPSKILKGGSRSV
ncbi:sensor histidine kinase [Mesobacillus subterraneus]|uniref:histidine kinase n=1 Tax=Mesobacillus subterraneus TaxID=285983 RepID=A0A3R9DT63_9BACI|nr:sensor histidine kinase [Mesobacillus subterraneus]RSD26802.1 sensor histidine kinase [Mesobacillus subterraneus]